MSRQSSRRFTRIPISRCTRCALRVAERGFVNGAEHAFTCEGSRPPAVAALQLLEQERQARPRWNKPYQNDAGWRLTRNPRIFIFGPACVGMLKRLHATEDAVGDSDQFLSAAVRALQVPAFACRHRMPARRIVAAIR